MSVINTNVQSLIAQNVLAQQNSSLNTSLERLSTGVQINSGADNPSGLIAVQSFNQQNTGLTTAINNASLAGNVVGTAEGGLSTVSDLLTQLQGLVGETANSGGESASQVAANQLQVNSILQTINRIANGTTFEGTHLLNGNLSYVTSSLKSSALQNLQINTALLPSTGNLEVKVEVVASATQAKITSTITTVTGQSVTLEVTGNLGTAQLSFGSGTTAVAIASAINQVESQTGVTASATLSSNGNAKNLDLVSEDFGSSQFVSVKATGFNYAFNVDNSKGTDATVTVNGGQASVQGLSVAYNSSGLDLSFNIANGLNKDSQSESFFITGGGANFALGAQVNTAGQASIGIADVSTASLGDATDGYLSSIQSGGANALDSSNSNALTNAQNIINAAITQVSTLRGQLGAFQDYTIGSTVDSLNVAYENSSAAESTIQDTNFAAETSNLTRAQILQQAATTVLTTANAAPQEALTLLRGT
jgi:flagellin